MKKDIRKIIYKKVLFFDGATGTNLQQQGLKPGESPETRNISHPESVEKLHLEYINAGADIIKTNTFGAYKNKFSNYGELIEKGFECVNRALAESGRKDVYVAFDMGPTGCMLAPFGTMGFEEAVDIFACSIREAVKYGPDLILIETMNDCLETKAAVIAAKENSDLPVFVTNTYDKDGKLLTGGNPETMIAMLESMGVDAIGLNCGTGPEDGVDTMKLYKKYSSIPLIANPNAGIPKSVDGRTVFDMTPKDYAKGMKLLRKSGASIIGGCCGTTPAHIAEIVSEFKNDEYAAILPKRRTLVSSYTHAVEFGRKTVLIGERINPTGKPKLKAALREGNTDYLISEGIRQEKAGVDILDVNVGLPEIDEARMLSEVVYELQAVCDLPLQLDSAKPEALERAMRSYAGKPLINSINGKKEVMDSILPLVKKYGGAVIALTLDENGIPETAEGRVQIAKNIVEYCKKYGIRKKDIIFDPLTMTVSSDTESANVTLSAVRMLKKMGFKTSLGVSNVSFGLPHREAVNSYFLKKAKQSGLSAAIVNPFAPEVSGADETILEKLISGKDVSCLEYIRYAESMDSEGGISVKKDVKTVSCGDTLRDMIISGLKNQASDKTLALLSEKDSMEIIDGEIIPALDICGKDFESKKTYLPQLLMSADAATASFDIIRKAMKKNDGLSSKGTVILATVKGDIHDIGKNIVKVLLESYGFNVIDLGRDVSPETVTECALEKKCNLVGLSALMTTTVPSMEETISLLHKKAPSVRIIVGGAVLNEEYARLIQADKYAKDAMDTVRFAQEFYSL